ncbi:MAG: hypothetical protein BGO90_04655 [Legionella sp. 40-6]|nr:SPOR domain-containing protein [Legionella sp.]OJY40903.1 MAG: hypothetical protein BGO90_04655 [Legionella sp. 40-6]
MKNVKVALTLILGFSLSSCVITENETSDNLYYTHYAPTDEQNLYSGNNYKLPDDRSNYKYTYESSNQQVVVPDSYHVGQVRSPVRFQERDQVWVSSQSPKAYTIELAESNKPAQVARVLYNAPKNNRMAQVRSQRFGKIYYKGVYGSYNTAAEAQQAMESLPAEIRQHAVVKSWSSIQ